MKLCEGYANVGDADPFARLRSLSVERRFRTDTVLSFPAALVTAYRGEPIPADFRHDRLINYRALNNLVVYYVLSDNFVRADELSRKALKEGREIYGKATADYAAMLASHSARLASMRAYGPAGQYAAEAVGIFLHGVRINLEAVRIREDSNMWEVGAMEHRCHAT